MLCCEWLLAHGLPPPLSWPTNVSKGRPKVQAKWACLVSALGPAQTALESSEGLIWATGWL